MSEQRLNITIRVINATQGESSEAITEAIGRLSAGTSRGDGEHYAFAVERLDDGTGGYGCDPNELPSWLFGGWEGQRREHDIGGQRWVRSDHVMLACRGKAPDAESPPHYNQRLLAIVRDAAQVAATEAVRMMPESRLGTRTATWLADDHDGDEARDFRADISPAPFSFALRYVALIEWLYPGCSWWVDARGGDVAQAVDVDGHVVAVLMPTTDRARHA